MPTDSSVFSCIFYVTLRTSQAVVGRRNPHKCRKFHSRCKKLNEMLSLQKLEHITKHMHILNVSKANSYTRDYVWCFYWASECCFLHSTACWKLSQSDFMKLQYGRVSKCAMLFAKKLSRQYENSIKHVNCSHTT